MKAKAKQNEKSDTKNIAFSTTRLYNDWMQKWHAK